MAVYLLKTCLFLGLLLGLLLAESVQAGMTRISIVLIGVGCAGQRPALADQLNRVPGIVSVDGHSVPDHLLIDVEDGTPTAEQLVSRLNDALTSKPCKAEEMKSCITAEPLPPQTMSR
jgi:hypothetical protein